MDIMQAIVDIEKTVRGIADSAGEMQENYDATLQEEIRIREQDTDTKIKDRLEQLRMRVDAERQEKMEQLETVYEQKLEALSKKSKANQDAWVTTVTQAVIRP